MLESMTGFASKTFTLSNKDGSRTNITMSLKSLNSRFFESTIKLPLSLNHLETKLMKIFKQELMRGHIFFIMHLSDSSFTQGKIEPALSNIQGYLAALEKIKQQCSVPGSISLPDMLRLPNIFNIEERQLDPEIEEKILNEIKSLTAQIIQTRKAEGQALQKDIEQRSEIISKELEKIQTLSEEHIQEIKSRIAQKIEHLPEGETSTKELEDLQYELDRLDIHEEIVRFSTHLNTIVSILGSSEREKGRRLDFTLQELVREINTIASKCSNAPIATHTINIKVELEKKREQVQNIV
jgi:uncharacterized protein (TIGR00255 family)